MRGRLSLGKKSGRAKQAQHKHMPEPDAAAAGSKRSRCVWWEKKDKEKKNKEEVDKGKSMK